MTGPICQVCGTPILRNPKHGIEHWMSRQYCGNSCQQAAATANRISRIEDMLTDGDRPATIFRAFGVSRKHMLEWLRSHDRPDLADQLADNTRRLPTHGTDAAYHRHQRLNEPVCATCQRAHAAAAQLRVQHQTIAKGGGPAQIVAPRDEDWLVAPCRTSDDPDAWFPSLGGWATALKAKTICRTKCPLRAACLQGAMDRGEEYGIWGGLDHDERRRLKRKKAV